MTPPGYKTVSEMLEELSKDPTFEAELIEARKWIKEVYIPLHMVGNGHTTQSNT